MSCGLVVLVEGGAVGMTMCCGGGSGRACFDLSIITVYISLSSSTNTAPYHMPTIVMISYQKVLCYFI